MTDLYLKHHYTSTLKLFCEKSGEQRCLWVKQAAFSEQHKPVSSPVAQTDCLEGALHLQMWLKNTQVYFGQTVSKFTWKGVHVYICISLPTDDLGVTLLLRTFSQCGSKQIPNCLPKQQSMFLQLLLPKWCFRCSRKIAKPLYICTQQI